CEHGLDRDQSHAAPVHRQVSAARDATRVRLCVDLARLKGWDLREIENVMDVDARPVDFDPAETVDGEVAERMSRSSHGQHEYGDRGEEERQPLHAAYLSATGAHRREKWRFRASARRNHVFASRP